MSNPKDNLIDPALPELASEKWVEVNCKSGEEGRRAELDMYRANSVSNATDRKNAAADKVECAQPTVTTLDQWIEVKRHKGATVTKCYPTNKALLAKLDAAPKAPDLIYRRLYFRHGVPQEYNWVGPSANQRANGGIAMQRLTPEDFRATAAKETNGHAVSGSDPRPRPQARGGCECSACKKQTERLKAAGVPFL